MKNVNWQWAHEGADKKNVNSNLCGKQEDYSPLYWSVKFMHFPYKCIF